ncbi:MAG: redoxin domain-containing protein [Acidobacteria bacterium]|nr:redoxin domain-containing protein [Acidobacteriota bacterium]
MKKIIGAFFLMLFSFAVVLAQQTVITGQLMGSNGKPLPKAHIHLGYSGSKPKISVETAKDGSYQINTNEKGFLVLQFTGVNHQRKYIPLIIEDSTNIKLDVTLATNEYKADFNDIRLIDNFENPDPKEGKVLKKQADGSYIVEFETKKDRVEYEISGLEKNGRTVNGTQSEDYAYDGDGDYKSITSSQNGKVKIVFNPELLVRSNAKSKIVFDEKNYKLSALAKLYDGMKERENARLANLRKAEEQGKSLQDADREFVESLKPASNAIKNLIDKEKKPFIRQILTLEYFTYFDKEKDENLVLLALNEISPNSPLWSIESSLLAYIATSCKKKDKAKAYIEKFLSENKDEQLKAYTLFYLMDKADNQTEQKKYFDILQRDYPESRIAKIAKRDLLAKNTMIKVGAPVPQFSVTSIEDPKKTYSSESLKGKYYLIDFWATWCGPCVGELGNLHRAYDRFKSKNFEILSLSFDTSPEEVTIFRQGKWKMPWLHTFVEKNFESSLAQKFGVLGIPKAILVDPTGKIIATEDRLRGKDLDKTLSEILEN